MKEIVLTCPFTGVEFTALEYDDGTLIVKHPLTGQMNTIKFDSFMGYYTIPSHMFKHMKTVNITQAAMLLNVSRQRISQILKNDVIPSKKVNGSNVFLLEDVLAYKDNRKVGAPFKD